MATPLRSTTRKICSAERLTHTLARFKRQGRRVVFTNGCFDLLHVGHIRLLEAAKRLGEILVVGVNSDRSVRRLHKGPDRPVVPQRDRARLLAALACVDYVTIFDEPTPLQLIRRVKPDVLVKGADWHADRVVGRDVVERHGGRVVLVPLVRGRSTTRLLTRINRRADS